MPPPTEERRLREAAAEWRRKGATGMRSAQGRAGPFEGGGAWTLSGQEDEPGMGRGSRKEHGATPGFGGRLMTVTKARESGRPEARNERWQDRRQRPLRRGGHVVQGHNVSTLGPRHS